MSTERASSARPDADRLTRARPPVFLTELVGRDEQLEQLSEAVRSGRLVSLVGPGGAGKTRLAAAVVEALARERRPAGNASRPVAPQDPAVAWIELEPICESGLVARHVAATLGLREHPSRTPEEALVERIGDGPVLLVLDNCEHVGRSCARLSEALLRNCPRLTILSTSREPLRLPGERVWPVPPLSLPSDDAEEARTAPSVRLFEARVKDVLPSFSLDDASLPAVVRICRRLDGLPLAIELAAARVPVLPPAQLADRLDDMFRILASRSGTALPRHRTLRALIDWSYDLLSPDERLLLERLSVFVSGFTLEAAERVASGPAGDDVLDLLAGLVEKSLVVMRESHGEARYSMLETVRAYVLQIVESRASSSEDSVADSPGPSADRACHLVHARYHTELAESLSVPGRTHDRTGASRIAEEHENLRAALAWTLANDQPELALRICIALREFWRLRGFLSEALDWTRRACEEAEGDPTLACLRARALVAAAVHGRMMGEYVALQGWLAEAESIARESGDRVLLADALTQLGLSLRDREELDLARERLDEALSLWRACGDPRGLSRALGARSSLALADRDTSLARSLRLEATRISHHADDREAEAHALIGLGEVARMEGDLEGARDCNRRCLRLFEELGDRWHAAAAHHNLGWVEMHAGCHLASVDAFGHTVRLFRDAGNPFGLTLCLFGFAGLLLRAGDAESAAVALAAAESQAARVGVRPAAPADMVACRETAMGIAESLTAEARARAESTGSTMSLSQALRWAESRVRTLLELEPGSEEKPDDLPRVPGRLDGSGPEEGRNDEPPLERPVEPEADLRVHALGPLRIIVHGEALDADTAFASSKPCELLLLLLCHPEGVTREQVGLAFWPDASTAQVKNSFHVMMHRLRKGLGHAEWVGADGDRYRLHPELRIDFDVTRFEEEGRAALRRRRAGGDVEDDLVRVIVLYRGEFLEGSGAGDWHLEVRDRLRRLHADLLMARAEILMGRGRLEETAEAYRAVLARDRLHEEAFRGLMTCQARAGQRIQALKLFETFSLLLREELGADPDPATTELYRRLQRSEAL